uniref:Progesterone-induced-blocking factor 1-like n=1 Tax=Phallusia mammillata TaxID=59560 RepID=A0A6F9DNT7_9ASCI|nr:progesterone-induced-blocking factor 1-like [Phallusia mammillata]
MSEKDSNPSMRSTDRRSGGDTSISLSTLGDTGEITGLSGAEELTDLSQSDLYGHKDVKGAKKRGLKNEYERKQLMHDLQLLKIELSQKSLIIDNLKAQHMSKTEELEEKLHDALHKKQILQARLENALTIQQDDSRKRQTETQKELKVILDRQRDLEQTNRRLQAKATNIKSQLQRDNAISEEQYIELKSQPSDNLTVAEYFSIRLYESMQPMKIECDNLRVQRDKLSGDVAHLSHTVHNHEQTIMQERRGRAHAEIQVQTLTSDLENARKALDERSGKAQRFDSVLGERDRLDKEHAELMKKHSYLEAEHLATCKEMADMKRETDSMHQTMQILRQDKEYLTKNLSECSAKLDSCEDRLRQTQEQLEQVKSAREELYEKYAVSRDEARLVYERRLQTELDRIRMQTESELERLRSDSRESYERENRNLREARDLAVQDRDQMTKLRDEAEKRCEVYSNELKLLESSIDSRLSDYQNEARIKTFELDRLQLVHEETCKNLDKAQEESERLSRKLEVVTADYGELQRQSSATDAELRVTVRDLKSRLDTYEKIEKDMDDIVMQAAEVEVTGGQDKVNEAEKVLFSYGYGANIPTTAKQRMKQSLHLARRVLQLEKINTSLQSELQHKGEGITQLKKKLSDADRMLEETRQPYSYLIESMRKRDEELEKKRLEVVDLEEEVDKLKTENGNLRETKRVMSSDLERLLNHRQEMAVLKRTLANMTPASQRPHRDDGNLLASLESRRKSTPARDEITTRGRASHESDPRFPEPVVFTKQDKVRINPERYRKLKKVVQNSG